MAIDAIFLAELKALVDNKTSQRDILARLSEHGLSILDAIIAVRAIYGIKLAESKEIVSNSEHWRHIHESHHALFDELEEFSRRRE